MQTKSFHITNFGSFGGSLQRFADHQGYVEIHDDAAYYEGKSTSELEGLAEDDDQPKPVRAAAETELAERALQRWRKGNR